MVGLAKGHSQGTETQLLAYKQGAHVDVTGAAWTHCSAARATPPPKWHTVVELKSEVRADSLLRAVLRAGAAAGSRE